MSGGSAEPEGPRDKQCPHCGLYYRDQGNSFKFHEAACGGSTESTTTESTPTQSTPSVPDDTPSTEDTTTDTVREQNPAMSGPQPQTSGDSDSSDPDCPSCGGELVDFTGTSHHQGKPTPFDYLCSQCRKTWDDK